MFVIRNFWAQTQVQTSYSHESCFHTGKASWRSKALSPETEKETNGEINRATTHIQ